MKKTGFSLLAIFIMFLIWQLYAMSLDISILLPYPKDVFLALGRLFITIDSLLVIFWTVLRLLIVLVISSVVGILLGVISGFSKNFAAFMNPIVTVLRTIPVIAITIILLMYFEKDLAPYIITFLMLFPIIYQGIFEGIKNIDQELVDVYRLDDNHFFTGLTHCYLPLISKDVRTAILQSLGLGLKVMVMAEFLASTENSIGKAISNARVNFAFDEIFAWVVLLIVIALLLELLVNKYKPITEKKKRVSKC